MYRHVALLILLAAIWSSSFTLIKVAVETVPPTVLAANRLWIAAILLYAFLKFQGKSLPPLGKEWVPLFVVGLIGNSIPFFLISWGEVGLPSGLTAILMAIMPLTTLVLAHLFTDSDKITMFKLGGLTVGLGGVIFLIGPDALSDIGEHTIRELAVIGAAMSYAVTSIVIRRLPTGGDLVQRSTAVMICAALQMIPIALLIDAPWTLSYSASSLWANLYLGVMPTAVAAIIHFHLIAARGTAFFSSVNYIIPCMGIAWGVIFLGEVVEMKAIIALAIILSGVALANIKRS